MRAVRVTGTYQPIASLIERLLSKGEFNRLTPTGDPSRGEITKMMLFLSIITLAATTFFVFGENEPLWMFVCAVISAVLFGVCASVHGKVVVTIENHEPFNAYQFEKYGCYRLFWIWRPLRLIIENGILAPFYLIEFFFLRFLALSAYRLWPSVAVFVTGN